MNEFESKVVLITGAGRGAGRALAAAFATHGAIVAANDLTPVNLDETVAHIQANGGRAQAYVADTASKLALQTMLHAILDEYGRIDILVNALGASPRDALLEMDEWDWRRSLDLNLTGPFLTIQSVGRVMQAQGGGAIVNLISVQPNSASAIAGKNGLIGLTRAAGTELEAEKIRMNAVCAGFPGGESEPDLPEDPVNLVLFLCSEKAQNFQGCVLQAQPSD